MIRDIIEGIIMGLNMLVDYWQIVMFNRKVPRGICWLIVMILAPVNIIVGPIYLIFNRNAIDETYDEMIRDLEGAEAE